MLTRDDKVFFCLLEGGGRVEKWDRALTPWISAGRKVGQGFLVTKDLLQ